MQTSRRLPILLGITGLLAVLALAFPVLVVLGFFALILPGFILAFAPTAFAYLCLFSIGWYGANRFGSTVGIVAGLAIAGAAGIIPAKIINARSAQEFAKMKSNEVALAKAISNPEHLTILQPAYLSGFSNSEPNENETSCDDLCLAILYGGNAQSVTMGTSSIPSRNRTIRGRHRGSLPAVSHTIERGAACPAERLAKHSHWQGWKTDESFNRLILAVKTRIASGDCLVARPAKAAQRGIQFVFDEAAIDDQGEGLFGARFKPKIRTLEVWHGGNLLARSVDIEATELEVPMYLLPDLSDYKIDAWRFARRQRYKAEPIDSVERLRSLAGWPMAFPAAGIGDYDATAAKP